jgi:hypothetical protein
VFEEDRMGVELRCHGLKLALLEAGSTPQMRICTSSIQGDSLLSTANKPNLEF